jgi:hypothetical protein
MPSCFEELFRIASILILRHYFEMPLTTFSDVLEN